VDALLAFFTQNVVDRARSWSMGCHAITILNSWLWTVDRTTRHAKH